MQGWPYVCCGEPLQPAASNKLAMSYTLNPLSISLMMPPELLEHNLTCTINQAATSSPPTPGPANDKGAFPYRAAYRLPARRQSKYAPLTLLAPVPNLVHHQTGAQSSPSPSNALPLTRVPLELPMSRNVQAACSQANTACFSDTAESLIQI